MFTEHPEDNSLQDAFNLILNNLDRLEIRGRDSAGLSLGDNGVYLRGQIRDDALFQHVVRLPLLHHTVVAHTRWASVGEISVPNCHPVDGDRSETSAIIHARRC